MGQIVDVAHGRFYFFKSGVASSAGVCVTNCENGQVAAQRPFCEGVDAVCAGKGKGCDPCGVQ